MSAEIDGAAGSVASDARAHMTPEKLNRLAMWGTIGILVVAAAVFGARRAEGDPASSTAGSPVVVSSSVRLAGDTTGDRDGSGD